MFKDQSLFALIKQDDNTIVIQRFETTKGTQVEICSLFNEARIEVMDKKEIIIFNGGYKPDPNEILVIEEFEIDPQILDALKNPLGIRRFKPNKNPLQTIVALFMGKHSEKKKKDEFTIAFQRFKKEQYITSKGINIFHDKETFDAEKRFGISINDEVDCIFVDNQLMFRSFHFARQIFDLSEYYRVATDGDVVDFINNSVLDIDNSEAFMKNADSWVRRKIAIISDSGFLNKYSPSLIKTKGKSIGLKISILNKKIVMPSDKKELKNILRFFDEEIYKGMFTEEIHQTNSKRKAEIAMG